MHIIRTLEQPKQVIVIIWQRIDCWLQCCYINQWHKIQAISQVVAITRAQGHQSTNNNNINRKRCTLLQLRSLYLFLILLVILNSVFLCHRHHCCPHCLYFTLSNYYYHNNNNNKIFMGGKNFVIKQCCFQDWTQTQYTYSLKESHLTTALFESGHTLASCT